ncbi:MAG: alpha/beta hydrolase [Proteobacteria bacterium]|nr:alpha/beta hydrolase [Pseudomonadota bacterium]MBU1639490.1 alpha/beta hydrolase [Pseudomonadota bacterium]
MALRDQKISVGDCEIHHMNVGGAGGRSLLFLHGMKFNAATWLNLGTLAMMGDEGYEAMAIDLPGFGESPACDLDPVEVLRQIVINQKLDKPVLIGPSMGGKVALDFALTYPEFVGGLVLIGAVGVEERKEQLSTINVPTLIVWGSEDAISPLANGHLLAERIPNASLVLVQGAPHPCYLDQPDIWHWELTSFLAENFGIVRKK